MLQQPEVGERRRPALKDGSMGESQPFSAPLSFAQLQMWLMDQMIAGNPAYGMPVGLRLRGALNVAALEASFNEIIRRHEILRTTFAVDDGEPVQIIHPKHRISIVRTNLSHLPPDLR